MKQSGVVCLFVGALLGIYTLFFMDVGVSADTNGFLDKVYNDNPSLERDRFANNDLLNRRLCYMIVVAVLCISGTILIVAPDEQSIKQEGILLAQLNLLAGIANKLDVPVTEINEIMEPYGSEYEENKS